MKRRRFFALLAGSAAASLPARAATIPLSPELDLPKEGMACFMTIGHKTFALGVELVGIPYEYTGPEGKATTRSAAVDLLLESCRTSARKRGLLEPIVREDWQ